MTLQEQVGQRLVAGFAGTELTDGFRRLVSEHKIGNVILFRHNVASCAQLKRLCGEIQALVRAQTGHDAFITIDQEGGVVTRLPDDGVNVPGAMAIAATGDAQNAYRAGLLTGRELRALGVNFDLAPCVDINSNPDNPVIGARSYGDTPEGVSRYAAQMIRGLLAGGVLCAAKHFPGHGDTAVDSHLALPCVDKPLAELERMELRPFREAIAAGVPAVMSTHILFPQIEPERVPATLSRRIMTGLLRETLGFEGLIISDCLEMRAIKDHYGTVNGAVMAMRAGVDLVFISHDTALCGEAARAAEKAVAGGALDAREMRASAERIIACKEALARRETEEAFDFDAAREESERMLEKTIAQARCPAGGRPDLGENPLCIGCLPFRATLASDAVGRDASVFHETMARALHGTAAEMSADPSDGEIDALVSRAAGHSAAVVGTFNGHLRRGQVALVKRLAASGIPTVAVALRDPYDLSDLPEQVWALAAFEYTPQSLRAVARVLRGEREAAGRLPVQL